MKWETVMLSQICTLLSGFAWNAGKFREDGAIPIIRIQNLGNNENEKFVWWDDAYDRKFIVRKGDILLSLSGSIKVYVWDGVDALLNQRIVKLSPSPDIDPRWFFWQISNVILDIERMGKWALVNNVSIADLKDLPIPLPPLAEQKRIAAILDAADALRRKDQQLLQQYDALAQAIFIDMFGDPVKNERGWEKVRMEELMDIVRGGSPRPIDKFLGGNIPWIKIGDATKGDDVYLNSTREHIIEAGLSKTRLLPSGSLIFANCGVSLGFARIINFDGCIHDGWLAFSQFDENRINKIFLLKALNSITEYFRRSAPEGTQPNLNTNIVKNFELIVPPLELQKKFETNKSPEIELKTEVM
jgi:type I restriction enzyme S subunit